MLQNLSVVFSLRHGQGRTWTSAKDLLTIRTQLIATSTMLFTLVLVSLLAWLTRSTQISIVEERLSIKWTWNWNLVVNLIMLL